MPRQRTLKPEFFRDKRIATLGATTALVYQALWCWADDGGVARVEVDLLKGEAFARWHEITHVILMEALVALHESKRIRPYTVGDEMYAEIKTLAKHSPVNRPSQFRHPRNGQEVTDLRAALMEQLSLSPQGASSEPAAPSPSPSPSPSPVIQLQTAGALTAPADEAGWGLATTPPAGDDVEGLGKFYARLKPLLYPKPEPNGSQRESENRDVHCLKHQLAKRPQAEIFDAVSEARTEADEGKLPGWIEPGQNFTIRALLTPANGGIATFERFRHAAVKRREIAA